jgi:hypothetical protein
MFFLMKISLSLMSSVLVRLLSVYTIRLLVFSLLCVFLDISIVYTRDNSSSATDPSSLLDTANNVGYMPSVLEGDNYDYFDLFMGPLFILIVYFVLPNISAYVSTFNSSGYMETILIRFTKILMKGRNLLLFIILFKLTYNLTTIFI